MLKKILSCLCFLLCGILLSWGQQNERGLIGTGDSARQTGNTYAIIIGISDYKLVTDLQYAHKDAIAFEDFLLSPAGGKVPKSHIETFINENANRSNVGDAISIVARKAKPGDRVWFFFAGHGDMEDLTQIENGLLLLYNSPNGNYFGMNDDVLEILDLKRYLSPLSQKGVEMIFIVDACHSGNLNGGVQGVQQTASALASSWGKEYKILSCQPNQLSLESAEWGGGRGLFSLQMEEGIKGLADKNSDGKISMFELQAYIQANVAKYSEYKQIPMITGDLGKSFFQVDPATLAALKKQKELDYPVLAKANTKGMEEKYVDSLSPQGKQIWASYKTNMEKNKLIWPRDTNALKDYRQFVILFPDNPLTAMMRRNLAAALNNRFDSIVSPLLKGRTSYSTRDACFYAAVELDSCIGLLGPQHYMYAHLKARKLYMEAMSYTWALGESEYNYAWRPTVQNSLKLLEESAALEPNAAYTLLGLGTHYYYLYEYEKANLAFQKFLELQPYNSYANYSLGIMHVRMKDYKRAETVFLSLLQQHPDDPDIKSQLFEMYWISGQNVKAQALMNKMIARPSEKMLGYFFKGLYHAREMNLDSCVFYYNETRKYIQGPCTICDNNIGHAYFVHSQPDSARKYFEQVLKSDSTFSLSHFNLGVLEEKEGRPDLAIQSFLKSILYSPGSEEGFVSGLHFYFGKQYDSTDKKAWDSFRKKMYMFNMQYASFLAVLYAYIRVPGQITNDGSTTYIFEQLHNYRQHTELTWFHHACFLSLKKDTAGALQSLKKALELGFGDYFQIVADKDLEHIRKEPAYQVLLQKYFQADSGKKLK